MKKFKYYIGRNNAIYETTTLKAAISGAKQLATESGYDVLVASNDGVIGYVEHPYICLKGTMTKPKFYKVST